MRNVCRPAAVVLAILASSQAPASQGSGPGSPRVVHVTAERFDFYPSRITVEQGELVELRITSEDTSHGFRVIGAGINVQVPKRGRGEVVVRFRGDRPGRYTFECSRICGAGHHFMRGSIVVQAPRGTGEP
jgi:cytochrome c oxidase subunit 2